MTIKRRRSNNQKEKGVKKKPWPQTFPIKEKEQEPNLILANTLKDLPCWQQPNDAKSFWRLILLKMNQEYDG